MDNLHKLFPCRRKQIDLLGHIYNEQPFPDAVFVHGCSGTGKSTIVAAILDRLARKYATINLIECYTPKILFESILNQLAAFKVDATKGRPFARANTLEEFANNLIQIEDVGDSVIVLDKAEELRNMDFNILSAFLKLREITHANVTVILISEIVYEKYLNKSGGHLQPIKVHFPQYNMAELMEILASDYDAVAQCVKRTYPHLDLAHDFYNGYLKMFLGVFYRVCRDLRELRHTSRLNFLEYCAPIANGQCEMNDASQLWRRIAPILKSSLEVLYMRVSRKTLDEKPSTFVKEDLTHSLELPFYAKYLLIAAYLASYNPPKDDKRLFVRHHGKKRKTMRDITKKNKVVEKMNTQLGPRPFNFERLVAIFYAILEEKVDFDSRLLASISTLVELQLLLVVAGGAELEARKFKCCIGFEFVEVIARNLDFNIRKYLVDFN